MTFRPRLKILASVTALGAKRFATGIMAVLMMGSGLSGCAAMAASPEPIGDLSVYGGKARLSDSELILAQKIKAVSKDTSWQCVTFVREITDFDIRGNAWTWWDQAAGRYVRASHPEIGSVLVFRPQGRMQLGHVAVVSRMITDRLIQITHANWSPINGRRGQVEQDVNVLDVSNDGDWTVVKVWYGPLNDVGTTAYRTYGFILPQKSKPLEAKPIIASVDQLPPALLKALTPDSTQQPEDQAATYAPVTVSSKLKGDSAKSLVSALDQEAQTPQSGTDETIAQKGVVMSRYGASTRLGAKTSPR